MPSRRDQGTARGALAHARSVWRHATAPCCAWSRTSTCTGFASQRGARGAHLAAAERGQRAGRRARRAGGHQRILLQAARAQELGHVGAGVLLRQRPAQRPAAEQEQVVRQAARAARRGREPGVQAGAPAGERRPLAGKR
jgi:hypothetical protein